jgi:hypothetical protein
MKYICVPFITFCISCLAYAGEPIASIEGPELGSVPLAIRSTIQSDASFNTFKILHCEIQGKRIPLSSDSSVSTWFVTTSDACGWGAALGPIWIVANRSKGNPVLLLTSGGYALSIIGKSHNEFASIAIYAGNAEGSTRNLYIFNGKKYVSKKAIR